MGNSAADGKKRKTKKIKQKLDDVAIPLTRVPCSTANIGPSSLSKKICFWGLDTQYRETSWFVVNIPIDVKRQQLTEEMSVLAAFDHRILHRHIERGVNEIPLTPVFSLVKRHSPIPLVNNTCAMLDSFLYSIGGTYHNLPVFDNYGCDSTLSGSNLVFYIDMNDKYGNYCWKQAPSMITHRRNPQVITVNRKLYVFGCFGQESCEYSPLCCSWAEVFNPSTSEWSSLPVPLFQSSLAVCSPNHMKKNHIVKKIAVLVDDVWVYELDIETKSWDRIATFGPNFGGCITEPVLVDSVFYWFTDDANAYDILKDEKFEGPVQDYSFQRAMNMVSKKCIETDVKPKVLHLGKRYFCVLAHLSDLEEGSRRIHCVIIKLSKTKEWYKQGHGPRPDVRKFFLRAHVLSCHSFPIDRELTFLDGQIM